MIEITKKIKEKLEELQIFKSVEIAGAGFNGLEDLKKFSQIAPSSRVVLVNNSNITRTNEDTLEFMANLSILFTAKDEPDPRTTRHENALIILEKILSLVKNGRWGVEGYKMEDTEQNSIQTGNYSVGLMATNIALWRVDWVQKVVWGTSRFAYKEPKNGASKNGAIVNAKKSKVEKNV